MKNNFITSFFSLFFAFVSMFYGCSINPDFDGVDIDTSKEDVNVYEVENSAYEYNIPERYFSEGIKNMVKRSRQIYEMTWMPVAEVKAFNDDYIFEKGTEVQGIPYSQPVYSGSFVLYGTSIDKFLSESKKATSKFYTERGTYEEPSTYYGLDCSAFVSYVWNCKNRLTAKNISEFGDLVGNKLNSVQVGDALIRTDYNSHAVVVTGVKEDKNKNVCWIEITEQTPPLTKRTRYGENELFTIDEFLKLYLKDGYKIYRNTDFRDNTPYTHICASPVDDMCDNCPDVKEYKHLSIKETFDESILFQAEISSLKENETYTFSYRISHIHLGCEKFKTDPEHYIKLRNEPGGSQQLLLVSPGSFVTIFDKIVDSDGTVWGKSRYENNVGWLNLTSSTSLGGEVIPGEMMNIPAENATSISIENYPSAFRCVFSIPHKELGEGKKIQVYATDSKGNQFLIGEYHIDFV